MCGAVLLVWGKSGELDYVLVRCLVLGPRVHCDKAEVVWRVEDTAAFERGYNGLVGELAGCVMSTNEEVVVGFALPRYVCARVWKPA